MWLPLAKAAVLKLAVPLASVAVLSVVVPSLKVTVPVALAGLTVAVRVTICPAAAELGVTSKPIAAGFVAGLITSATVADVLALLLESPLYDAVSVWLPTARLEVTSAAAPLDIATVPRVTAPSLNAMAPVALVGITTALRVTCCPTLAGFGRAAMPVVVVAFPPVATVSATVAEVLPLKALSPLYWAVREWLPAARIAVEREAIPVVRLTVPIAALLSLKVTVPVALEGVTVAVRVTVWPKVAEAWEGERTVVDVALAVPA